MAVVEQPVKCRRCRKLPCEQFVPSAYSCGDHAPNGQVFELQFHTPEGFELKDGVLHELNEQKRLTEDLEFTQTSHKDLCVKSLKNKRFSLK